MKKYLDLLETILENGILKEEARTGMPNTISIFGEQLRFDLSEGFPLLTTKPMFFRGIVVELLWFMKGDTNIKFLVDNRCNIWNEDAYNYYLKKCKESYFIMDQSIEEGPDGFYPLCFDMFIEEIKNTEGVVTCLKDKNYTFGDCGEQYGKLWRKWSKGNQYEFEGEFTPSEEVDQLKELLEGLEKNPMSRRHIITAWNPATLDDMALNACHVLVQFNCRPLTWEQKLEWAKRNINPDYFENLYITELASSDRCPKYYLDCQLYQRSADVVLGVPFNIASYALLTMIISKVVNMVPGDFIHTFGDVHIYESHIEAVKEQIQRKPMELSKLNINTEFWATESGSCGEGKLSVKRFLDDLKDSNFIKCLIEQDIQLESYVSHPKLENPTELFTGLKK